MEKTNKKYKYIVSFPHLENYYIPVYNLLNNIVDKEKVKVLMPKKITNNTIMQGAKSSPDFACVPFKYNMGNYIEALEDGANVLIQAGGGCRYGYYYEVQEQILKDMGYNFTFIPLMEEDGVNVLKVYRKLKILNENLSFYDFCYYFLLGFKMINILDKFESYIRINFSLQDNKKEFEKIHKELLLDFMKVKNMSILYNLKRKYTKKLKEVKLNSITKDKLKIGIVGELFTSMEPYSSFFIEKELTNLGCIVKRYTTATYLLFQKGFAQKSIMKKANKYIDYQLGADGAETIAHTLEMIEQKYDGIIHIKPFGCSPEINAMPMLQNISKDYDIPIMYLTFDEQTTATGIKTRIEAFYDMLVMKKEKIKEINKINNEVKVKKKVKDAKVLSPKLQT